MSPQTPVRPSRIIQKFNSFAEQEEADFRYWMARTPAQRLAAAADMARHAYSFRDPALGRKPFAHLKPVRDQHGRVIPPSRVIRKFTSFAEQQAWNDTNAWPRK